MSSSDPANPDLSWELLKLSLSDSSTSTASAGLSRSGSGESGGVVSKRFPLLSIDSVALASLCAGYVGKGGSKRFCTQRVDHPGGTCTVSSHASPKFSVIEDSFYTRASNQVAFCHPSYPQALVVSAEQREALRSESKTQAEWRSYFSNLERLQQVVARDFFDEDVAGKPSVSVRLDFDPTLGLKTPAKRYMDGKVERIWETELTPHLDVPDLPLAASESIKTFWDRVHAAWPASMPTEVLTVLKNLHNSFIELSETWPAPFRDIEQQFGLIGTDLEKVQSAIEKIRMEMGSSIPLQDVEMPDIWCALDYLATTVADLQAGGAASSEVTHLKSHVKELQEKQLALGTLIHELKATSVEYGSRFSMIGPVLLECKRSLGTGVHSSGGVPFSAMEDVDRRIRQVEAAVQPANMNRIIERLAALENAPSHPNSWLGGEALSASDIGGLKDTIAKLTLKVDTLERRIVGDGLSIGPYSFQSFDDLCVWMKMHVKNNRYGLFVDAVALFELFSMDHIDTATALGSFNNSQKTGFATMYEATLAASMQNVLPTLLGKGSIDGMDTSRFLPGLKNCDQWSLNGVSGLKYQIERELPNVDSQVNAEISTAFQHSPEAAGLARECLFTSKRFITMLCQYITNDFEFWSGRGYSKVDAWALVCQSLRRIFDEIHAERVYGRHVKSNDVETTAAKYVWAVLKAHKIQSQFDKHNFSGHPSISAVVARHLASNHFKPSDDTKGISSQIKKCESSVSDLARKLDSLESKVNNKLGKGVVGEGGGGRPGRGKRGDDG